jgi:hypothetical protein
MVTAGNKAMTRYSGPLFGDLSILASHFQDLELKVVDAFTRSFPAKVAYISILVRVLSLQTVRKGLISLFQKARRMGWQVALITAFMQVATLVIFSLQDPSRIFEPSIFNTYVSAVAAIGGGLGEETICRGLVILTLAMFSPVIGTFRRRLCGLAVVPRQCGASTRFDNDSDSRQSAFDRSVSAIEYAH